MKQFIAILMSLILSNVTALASGSGPSPDDGSGGIMVASLSSPMMIPTSTVIDELTAKESRQNIENLLKRDDVRTALSKRGISDSEISSRLATLSQQEMQQLNKQLDQARYGGDILVTVLLVVLIIFLIQRI